MSNNTTATPSFVYITEVEPTLQLHRLNPRQKTTSEHTFTLPAEAVNRYTEARREWEAAQEELRSAAYDQLVGMALTEGVDLTSLYLDWKNATGAVRERLASTLDVLISARTHS